ncbi:S-adenosylmethionine-dependent methyltransferase [Motiliproteus coralliicola]|uniref:S-adenosylmethionine-dependent methyltransferase n=1 Tax=Motiliproteus coralliicola TaxID=2283196 RepID=A0A369WXE0_9GAMM|nr:SAM-dependent methyltransferase [Motiliproteus coralliicola]RDE25194.1 S-adenosylmethionine-dependent methyltransferase [Motiliproteus coralliicola]
MPAQLIAIGQIRTPFLRLDQCPRNIQPDGPQCQLQLNPPYWDELRGLKPGQLILILYWLGAARPEVGHAKAQQVRWQRSESDSDPHGVFSLRTPIRPNPIGAAVVPIDRIDEGCITVIGLDCLDGTVLLDIKPAIYRETGSTA